MLFTQILPLALGHNGGTDGVFGGALGFLQEGRREGEEWKAQGSGGTDGVKPSRSGDVRRNRVRSFARFFGRRHRSLKLIRAFRRADNHTAPRGVFLE